MNVFVTGAAGFIGSHICKQFVDLGHQITGLDNFDPYYPENIKRWNIESLQQHPAFRLVEGDVRNKKLVSEILSAQQFDLVIHMAGKSGVRPSIDAASEYYDVNVNGTLNLLECMKVNGVRKMLFASSSSVYGNNDKTPFSESDMVDNPISPYAASKKAGELLCHVYTHLHGFDITCLRLFTVYGPGQRPDLAIHKFTRLIDEGKPIPVYGNGTTTRDYTFISDILSGFLAAADNLGAFRIYNLGNSATVSLKNLVQVIENTLGKKAILDVLPEFQGDVNTTYADITRAGREIGYNPCVDIESGIRKFVQWFNDNKVKLYTE